MLSKPRFPRHVGGRSSRRAEELPGAETDTVTSPESGWSCAGPDPVDAVGPSSRRRPRSRAGCRLQRSPAPQPDGRPAAVPGRPRRRPLWWRSTTRRGWWPRWRWRGAGPHAAVDGLSPRPRGTRYREGFAAASALIGDRPGCVAMVTDLQAGGWEVGTGRLASHIKVDTRRVGQRSSLGRLSGRRNAEGTCRAPLSRESDVEFHDRALRAAVVRRAPQARSRRVGSQAPAAPAARRKTAAAANVAESVAVGAFSKGASGDPPGARCRE